MLNNALAYPGIFRGLLDMNAAQVSVQQVTAAARTLAAMAGPNDLMPEMMNPATHQGVAQAVMNVTGKGDPLVK